MPPFLTASVFDGLPIAHGFFGRRGGVSAGIYDSLNCGFGSADGYENVRENRRRVRDALGAHDICSPRQIHSATAVDVADAWLQKDAPEADGVFTKTPGVALGILTADCVPVLFADRQGRAVAAAHAGWRGAVDGILEATLKRFAAQGIPNAEIVAAIGPCIAQCSYEVGAEFCQRFTIINPRWSRFFTPSGRDGRSHFAIGAFVEMRLHDAGLAAVERLDADTLDNPETYFSYRRTTLQGGGDYGRQLSAITLRKL